jgi:hypothetical protein
MQPNTVAGYRAAYKRVLDSNPGDWLDRDLRTVDIGGLLNRFELARRGALHADTIVVYGSRFENLTRMYLDYFKNPVGWEYRPLRSASGRGRLGVGGQSAVVAQTDVGQSSALIRYRFPVREGLIIELELPVDLRSDEAERLKAFIGSLPLHRPSSLPGPQAQS